MEKKSSLTDLSKPNYNFTGYQLNTDRKVPIKPKEPAQSNETKHRHPKKPLNRSTFVRKINKSIPTLLDQGNRGNNLAAEGTESKLERIKSKMDKIFTKYKNPENTEADQQEKNITKKIKLNEYHRTMLASELDRDPNLKRANTSSLKKRTSVNPSENRTQTAGDGLRKIKSCLKGKKLDFDNTEDNKNYENHLQKLKESSLKYEAESTKIIQQLKILKNLKQDIESMDNIVLIHSQEILNLPFIWEIEQIIKKNEKEFPRESFRVMSSRLILKFYGEKK